MIEIRSMQIEDIDQVAAIERENFSTPWDENGFLTYLVRQGTVFLVAEEAGKVIGYCGMVSAADEGDIISISVSKKNRGKGVGDRLVKALVLEAGKIGVKKIFLEVRERNEAAIGLYLKNKFLQVGIRKKYYKEPEENALLMVRLLQDA